MPRQTRRRPADPDAKLTKSIAVTGAVVAVIGVPAAVVAGHPLSTLVIVVSLMIGLPVALRWYFRRAGRQRLAVVAPAVAVTVLAASVGTALLFTQSRNFLRGLINMPVEDRVAIVSGTVPKVKTDDGKAYDRFTMAQSDNNDSRICEGNHPYRYRVDGDVVLIGTRPALAGHARQIQDGEFGEAARPEEILLPFDGTASGMTCGPEHFLRISFEIAAVLAAGEYTKLEIDVPAHLFSPTGPTATMTGAPAPAYVKVVVEVADAEELILRCTSVAAGYRCEAA